MIAPWYVMAYTGLELIGAFVRFVIKKANVQMKITKTPTLKPHGRLAYAIPIGHEGHYLDVSVMPRSVAIPEPEIPDLRQTNQVRLP